MCMIIGRENSIIKIDKVRVVGGVSLVLLGLVK